MVDELEKGMMATARSVHKKMEKVEAVLTPQQVRLDLDGGVGRAGRD